MKRILPLLVAFVLLLIGNTYAAQRTATFGDQNSSGVYRMRADVDTVSGSNVGYITYAQDTGIYYPYTTATTTTTLIASQTGTTMVFTGSSNNTRFTLPAATVGMEFTFIDDTTNYMAVYPATGDTINFASLPVSNGLANSSTPAKGDSVTLFCAVAGKWSVEEMRNTWVSIAP